MGGPHIYTGIIDDCLGQAVTITSFVRLVRASLKRNPVLGKATQNHLTPHLILVRPPYC